MTAGDESHRRLQFLTPGVSLRSASGNRESVVLDGEYLTNEMIFVAASDVTIADITIMRAVDHPIHVTGGQTGDITGVLLYNLHIIDGGEQFVKVNSSGGDPNTYADHGRLECSLLEMTDDGRPHVEPSGGGCYTGGIDGHQARGWGVRLNTFRGIYCTNGGLAEHAVHFWTGSRDTVVERNTIIDCARGIGFGLVEDGASRPYADDPYPEVGYIGHYDGMIRNNFVWAQISWFDTGIELDQARGTRVYHNTVVHPASAFSSIDYRFANTMVDIQNNIVMRITQRNEAQGTVASNLENAADSLFAGASEGDLHLVQGASSAIDQGVVLTEAGLDIDGEAHDVGAPDLGADEASAP